MKQINTPFGILYITEWDKRNNNLYPEATLDGSVVIYDSKGKFFDRFSSDYFDEDANDEILPQKHYTDLCEMLELGATSKDLEGFLDWLCFDYDYAGPNKEQAELALSDGHPENLLPDEVETSEYVLHLGNNYIVVRDY